MPRQASHTSVGHEDTRKGHEVNKVNRGSHYSGYQSHGPFNYVLVTSIKCFHDNSHRRWIRYNRSVIMTEIICNFAKMEGYYVEKTWPVFESHSRNTFSLWRRRRFDCTKTELEPYKAIRQKESQRNERYQVAGTVGLWNESLYVEMDFLSACYECRLSSPQKFLSFALLKHNPGIYLVEFQAWLPDRQIICKANRQQNHTARGIVSNKKVMKAVSS